MDIYVLTGKSESGDDYGALLFSEMPTNEQLKEIAHEWDGDEDEGGCGNYGSYVYMTLEKTTVDSGVGGMNIRVPLTE